MENVGRRIIGGIGAGLLLLSTLLPFFGRGSIINENLETLSLVSVYPWLGVANIGLGLAALALAIAGLTVWMWAPLAGALACFGVTVGMFRPYDYGIGIGAWTYIAAMALLLVTAAWLFRRQ